MAIELGCHSFGVCMCTHICASMCLYECGVVWVSACVHMYRGQERKQGVILHHPNKVASSFETVSFIHPGSRLISSSSLFLP